MSRTHRKHLSPGKQARLGPKNPREDEAPPARKSAKQRRPNERAKLRREFL